MMPQYSGGATSIALTGSIANDYLMYFPGRFADVLLPDQLHALSVSFLVDELIVRRGGVAANIAFGMAQLGMRPILVGAVGSDFTEYQTELENVGVDCSSVYVSTVAQTARFICTTDIDQCQIAFFYSGTMAESSKIELKPISERVRGLDLVVISPNDPTAMLRHTQECREQGYPFAADPSQQITRMSGEEIRQLIDGASFLFTNEYERQLLISKTGLCDTEIRDRVGVWVTTLGAEGVLIVDREGSETRVPAARVERLCDPTGVGDAFRAGFLSALAWNLPLERSAQVGATLAAIVLETAGTQEYHVDIDTFTKRLGSSYGECAADDVSPYLS